MKQQVFLLFLLSFVISTMAQTKKIEKRPYRSLNASVLCDASLFAVNYERIYEIGPRMLLSTRMGLGYNEEFLIWNTQKANEYTTLPHAVTFNFGKRRSFFEIGMGGTIIAGVTSQHYILYPIISYRILPLNFKRLNMRVSVQIPTVGWETEDIFFFPIGLSIGYSY